MANTVSGLFPELAGALAANPLANAMRPVADPLAAYGGLITGAGAQLQQSIGKAFGQQTPQEQLQSIVQSVQQRADLGTPEGLLDLANELNQVPQFSGFALGMRQEAAKMAREQARIEAEVGLKRAQAEKALREPVEGKVLPPGSVMVDASGNVIARGEPVSPKAEQPSESLKKFKELVALGVPEERARAIAYKTEGTDIRREIQDQKIVEKEEKKVEAEKLAVANANRVITAVSEARGLVSPWTAGFGGSLSIIPGSDARKLQNKLTTIKANLGFDRLQQMRDASPTGGALGQVAVKEIEFLQSTVATLDQLDSPSAIKEALDKIDASYRRWLEAIQGRTPAASTQPAAPVQAAPRAQPAPAQQGTWRIVE
jgi:hypothetical protein